MGDERTQQSALGAEFFGTPQGVGKLAPSGGLNIMLHYFKCRQYY